MKIPNPFALILAVILWPFVRMFNFLALLLIRSDRAWGWLEKKMIAAGCPEATIQQIRTSRTEARANMTGTEVILPAAVEKSQPEQAEKQSEDKS